MNTLPNHTHHAGLPTERAAAQKAELSAMPLKRMILAVLDENPAGITPDEFCVQIGGLLNTVRRRFTDLWKEGKIRHHPDLLTRKNSDGNECVVWVLGEDTERKPSRYAEMVAEIARLRDRCARLIEELERNTQEIDSYGEPGSNFRICAYCRSESGAGLLDLGIPHEPDCILANAQSAGITPEEPA